MTRFRLFAAAVVLLLPTLEAVAQFGDDKPRRVQFTAVAVPSDPFVEGNAAGRPADAKIEVGRGDVFLLTVRGTPEKDWYTYPFTRRAPDQSVVQLGKLTVEGGEAFQPMFPVSESAAEWKKAGDEVYLAFPGPFSVSQPIYVRPSAKPGPATLKVKLRVQVCSKVCIWEDHELAVPVTVSTAPAAPPGPELERRLAVKPAEPAVEPFPSRNKQEIPKGRNDESSSKPAVTSGGAKGQGGLWAAILAAAVGGFVSLLTPCVFPMIPITVSYFIKQSEAGRTRALAMATVYCATLVLVLTLGGLVLLETFVAISVHWATNFVLGGIFVFFALSLLGMYEITLPSWLQDITSSGEGKGGLAGVFFMALTFSIVSFACVGPIYGSFIGLQATGGGAVGQAERALPVLAFSSAFASPFFVLAMFPTLLRGLPRAGSWMNSVKVVMGFLELAAAVKFLRAGELLGRGKADFLSYDVGMALYVTICAACGLYLLNLYRLPHDHEAPESVGVPRLMFAMAFLGLGLYLLPSMFKAESGESQRPSGKVFAWIDSFLLPDPDAGTKRPSASQAGPALVWGHDLQEALSRAEKDQKLVFLDFTGTVCTNCKLNERDVFPRPEVQQAFAKHVLLKLYTDKVPAGVVQDPDEAESVKLRNTVFRSEALPLYALLKPTGDGRFDVVGRFGDDGNGLIEDVPAFVKFLSR
ncbi:MAG: cytochrome c biogenesis protein CcdA [Gemmataceae bacterium]